jgi:AcrR family transcriptional regulator
MASGKRDHLVDTALELFYQDGFHATGIDRILETAGVARMTLYNHFKSKDELIVAALRRRDEKFRNWFMRTVERLASRPEDRLLAIYDALNEWFSNKDFCGCMFINASAEFGDPDDPIHMVATEHKQLVRRYLGGLVNDAGATEGEGEALADELMLLMEGAIVMAHVAGDHNAAGRARLGAQKLVRLALS